MSYATGTTHYNLPLTVGTDKRDWADTNQAFSDLDAAVYGAVSDVATAGTAIEGLETRMTTAEGNISDNTADITSLDTRMTTAEGAITSLSSRVDDVGNDLGDMICAYNEATATSTHAYAIGDYFRYNNVLYRATQQIAIGDTIVPDTNCTTTNVTTEIQSIEDLSGDVSALDARTTTLENKMAAAETDIENLQNNVLISMNVEANVTTRYNALRDLLTLARSTMSESDLEGKTVMIDGTAYTIEQCPIPNFNVYGIMVNPTNGSPIIDCLARTDTNNLYRRNYLAVTGAGQQDDYIAHTMSASSIYILK